MLPDFDGKRVLDLGCGFGWHCIYAAEQGAASVVGVDISEKMLAVAREKTNFSNVCYVCAAIEEYEYPENSFDIRKALNDSTMSFFTPFYGLILAANYVNFFSLKAAINTHKS